MTIKSNRTVSLILAILLAVSSFSVLAYADSVQTYKLTLAASNGEVEVRVNGEIKHSGSGGCIINIPVGADVTVSAVSGSGELMLWTDENKNTCSESESYSFKMICPKEIRAWFLPAEGTTVLYRNDNTTKQVLGSATCVDPSHFNSHIAKTAYKLGARFVGWSMSVEEIKEKISEGERLVIVSPIYEAEKLTARIRVVGGSIEGLSGREAEVDLMTKLILKADEPLEGKSFVGWTVSDGSYISEKEALTVEACGDMTYTAVFEDSSDLVCPVSVTLEIRDNTDGTLRLWSSHFAPDDCSVISYGFIYAEEKLLAEQYMTLELAEERELSVAEYTREENSGILTCTSEADSIFARAFMVYRDPTGEILTAYSSAVSSSVDK